MMKERFLGYANMDLAEVKIVYRVLRAYKKFNLLKGLSRRNEGFVFKMSDERFNLLQNEIELSFVETGLA